MLFSPPQGQRTRTERGASNSWSQAYVSWAALPKASLRQALQSVSFTANFPSCFLIKFSASFKYQSTNHPHFLQIPLKTWNRAIPCSLAQPRHEKGCWRGSTKGLQEAGRRFGTKHQQFGPKQIFRVFESGTAAASCALREQHPTCSSLQLQGNDSPEDGTHGPPFPERSCLPDPP